jgi:glutamate synthase (NADPH/NADH) small chain
MPDPNGFLRYDRKLPARRPVPVRIRDFKEVYPPAPESLVKQQASRCMDCGIPFCTSDTAGCPLGNRIPDWNDLVRTGSWDLALESLHATNNFPEFTGRLCPAPCEAACVLGIGDSQPVTIKQIEVSIADRFEFEPRPATSHSGRAVAIVGSGPAGLAAAQQLARAGHDVTVFERDDRIGGLLRYGIPDFKLEKHHLDRRIVQLEEEGVSFRTGVNVGVDVTLEALRQEYDAVLLAVGALKGRPLDAPGSTLDGVHLAMEHLTQANRYVAFGETPAITAAGKHVVIIGGGDTAADCLGVAHRLGALSVTQLDRYPLPPKAREDERDPWPTWPWVLRNYPAHEEGGERLFGVAVQEFAGSGGRVHGIRLADVTVENRVATPVPGTEREIPADLVLLAIGFDGTDAELGIPLSPRRTVTCGPDWQTETPGVFVAGDAHRGASLIVWAIAEGRAAAASIHAYVGGSGSLPAPVTSAAAPLALR